MSLMQIAEKKKEKSSVKSAVSDTKYSVTKFDSKKQNFFLDYDLLHDIARTIIDVLGIVTDNDGAVWQKQNGAFVEIKNNDIFDSILANQFVHQETLKSHFRTAIRTALKDASRILFSRYPDFRQNLNHIYFDGFKINWRTGVESSISPSEVVFFKIPHTKGTCTDTPTIDKLAREVLGKEPEFLKDLLTYCMIPHNPNKYIFYLYGRADTGKSSLIVLFKDALGARNYMASKFELLIAKDARFEMYNLRNILLVVMSEIEKGQYSTNQLKQLSGNDDLRGERKGINGLTTFPATHKMFILCNDLPEIKNKMDFAYTTRTFVIEFPHQFERVLNAVSLHVPEVEFQNLVNYSVTRIKQWVSANKVSLSGFDLSLEEQHEQYLMKSNPTAHAMATLFEHTDDESDYVLTNELAYTVIDYLDNKNISVNKNLKVFGRQLAEAMKVLGWWSDRFKIQKTVDYYERGEFRHGLKWIYVGIKPKTNELTNNLTIKKSPISDEKPPLHNQNLYLRQNIKEKNKNNMNMGNRLLSITENSKTLSHTDVAGVTTQEFDCEVDCEVPEIEGKNPEKCVSFYCPSQREELATQEQIFENYRKAFPEVSFETFCKTFEREKTRGDIIEFKPNKYARVHQC